MKVNTPDLAKSTPNTVSARKKDLVRELILDAAQRLLTKDASGGFSMRDLAGEADLSLVTPYKYFGSKNGVFRALVERVMLQIEKRYAAASEQGPVERVLSMLDAGVETLLGDAAAFKTIGNVISLPKSEEEHKDMFQPATRLWQLALKDNFPIADDLSGSTCDMLAEELAVAFRGVVSLWLAGEIDDRELGSRAEYSVVTILLAFSPSANRISLVDRLLSVQFKLYGRSSSSEKRKRVR